jgi:hypothetical protein
MDFLGFTHDLFSYFVAILSELLSHSLWQTFYLLLMALRDRTVQTFAVPLLCAAGVLSISAIVFLPAAVSFIGAIAAACGWCIWLERHPDPFCG